MRDQLDIPFKISGNQDADLERCISDRGNVIQNRLCIHREVDKLIKTLAVCGSISIRVWIRQVQKNLKERNRLTTGAIGNDAKNTPSQGNCGRICGSR